MIQNSNDVELMTTESTDDIILTMNDYKILACMYQGEYNAPLKSITYNDLKEQTELSINKIRNSIKMFADYGYVKEGFQHIQAKGFFITKVGVQKVLKSIK